MNQDNIDKREVGVKVGKCDCGGDLLSRHDGSTAFCENCHEMYALDTNTLR